MSLINSWIRVTDYKLFGVSIFKKKEYFDGEMRNPDFDIVLTPDYYKAEFKTRKSQQ